MNLCAWSADPTHISLTNTTRPCDLRDMSAAHSFKLSSSMHPDNSFHCVGFDFEDIKNWHEIADTANFLLKHVLSKKAMSLIVN